VADNPVDLLQAAIRRHNDVRDAVLEEARRQAEQRQAEQLAEVQRHAGESVGQ
jgi:hypothetical protein